MVTKDKIKKEIDNIPEDQLEELYHYIKEHIQTEKIADRTIKTYHLKGKFDDMDIRKGACEQN